MVAGGWRLIFYQHTGRRGSVEGESAHRNCGKPVGLPNPAAVLYSPQQDCTPKRVSSPLQSVPPTGNQVLKHRNLLHQHIHYPIRSSQTPFLSPLCVLSTKFCLPLLFAQGTHLLFLIHTPLQGRVPWTFWVCAEDASWMFTDLFSP